MSKMLSWILGLVFLALAGLRAFQEPDLVLGTFEVTRTLNWLHYVTGIAGVLAAIAGTYHARLYLWTAGLLYLACAVAGFIAGGVPGMVFNQATCLLYVVASAFALYALFGEDPHLSGDRIPITGRRGVTDFRQPAHRW